MYSTVAEQVGGRQTRKHTECRVVWRTDLLGLGQVNCHESGNVFFLLMFKKKGHKVNVH